MNNQIQLVLKSSTTELSLNDHELGIYLTPELDGLTGLPEIRTTSGVNAGYDGGWTSAQNYDARSITIRGVIANENVATVEQLRRQLTTLAGQGKNEELTLDLVTQAGKAYTIQVRTIALEMALQKVLCQQEFMLQLRADDPLIYDGGSSGESVIVQVQKAIGGFQIDFELPLAISGGSGESTINNGGLEQVYPIIKMYGALHNPTFVNQTTNQQFQVNATLGFADGAWHTPSELYEGTTINIPDAPDNAPLASFQLDGETSQNGTPTPSAPVPVNTTTGENVVRICGKNLLDIGSYLNATSDNLTFSYSNGKLTATGTPSPNEYANVTKKFATYLPVGTYTLSITQAVSHRVYLWLQYKDGTAASTFIINAGNTSATVSTAKEIVQIRLDFAGMTVGTAINETFGIQLEKTNSASTFEPYQDKSYEVNLGKNLFDKSTATQNYRLGPDGAPYGDNEYYLSDYVSVDPSSAYYISGTSGSAIFSAVCFYATDKTFISRRASMADWYSFTTPANTAYIRFTTQKTNDINGVQLEKGSTATDFAPYFEPIELCKIGDYQDYIYKSDGKWYVRKEIGKATYNGSENWGYESQTYYLDGFNGKPYSSFDQNTPLAVSPHFRWGGGSSGTFNFGDFWYTLAGTRLRLEKDENPNSTTLASFKTWLGSNNLTIYYALATPTDTEITNAALVAQLEAVLGGHTYAGMNNITTITPNEQGTLEISYMTEKDADKRDVMVVDSRMRTVTLNGADIYHLITSGSEFPMLAPGENKLLLRSDTPGDNGYADVNYKQGYLTI